MKVVVLLGGDSPEREVSLASGKSIIRALRSRGHDAYPIDPALPLDEQAEPGETVIGGEPPESVPALPAERMFEWIQSPRMLEAQLVFVGLHGGAGEDGTVQAVLEAAGYVYTGTGVLGSALAMNKDRSKALFKEAGVQTAPHELMRGAARMGVERVREIIEGGIGFPVVIKPNCQGSSVGFSFVQKPTQLGGALEKAAVFGGDVIAERFIPGREITASVLDGEPLPLVEIIPDGGFYDYKRKYTKGNSRYVAPAEVEDAVTERIKREAALAYDAVLCRDYARVDFRLGEDGEPYCLEVNTLPGMTDLSLVPMAAGAAGISFDELVDRICRSALSRGECR
jgi:D-alanine-D-alanine ligase